ncbi:hypothetical protein F01_290072 [Burkholderia cenocepacia]|nr:hypothetical protein F01_290072 [Burkholderia cenocepacia]
MWPRFEDAASARGAARRWRRAFQTARARNFAGDALRGRTGRRVTTARRAVRGSSVRVRVDPFEQRVVRGARGFRVIVVDEADDDVALAVRAGDVAGDRAHVAQRAGLDVRVAEHARVGEAVLHRAVDARDRQRIDERLRDRARVRGLQQRGERQRAHVLFARQPRAVLEHEVGHRDAVLLQERLDRAARLLGRRGRLAADRADRQEQVARHHVVAELVDVVDDAAEHRAVMHGERPRGGRHLAFAHGPGDRAAVLLPQREEAAREEGRVIEDREVGRVRAAAQRVVAGERRRHDSAAGRQRRARGRGGRAARARTFDELVVDRQVRERRQHVDGDLAVVARRDRERHGLERVQQRIGADVVRRAGIVVERRQVARRRREITLVEHEAAGHALDAGLAQLVDEVDQLLGHELRIAGALDVQVALQRAVRVDRAVRVRGGAPAVVGAEDRQAREGRHELHRRGRQHRPARIPRDQRLRIADALDHHAHRRRRHLRTLQRDEHGGRQAGRARGRRHDGGLARFLVGFLAGLGGRREREGRAGGDDGGRAQADAGAGGEPGGKIGNRHGRIREKQGARAGRAGAPKRTL